MKPIGKQKGQTDIRTSMTSVVGVCVSGIAFIALALVHRVLDIPIGVAAVFGLLGVAGLIWGIRESRRRKPVLTITADEIFDHRSGNTYDRSKIVSAQLEVTYIGGFVNQAYLVLRHWSGGTKRIEVGFLDHSPETILRLIEQN